MIHDAIVEVTCDRSGCVESVFVGLEWVYRTMNESSGYYNANDSDIEERLVEDHDWLVRDGKHFCTPECASIGEE